MRRRAARPWQAYNRTRWRSPDRCPKPSQWRSDPYSMTNYDSGERDGAGR